MTTSVKTKTKASSQLISERIIDKGFEGEHVTLFERKIQVLKTRTSIETSLSAFNILWKRKTCSRFEPVPIVDEHSITMGTLRLASPTN